MKGWGDSKDAGYSGCLDTLSVVFWIGSERPKGGYEGKLVCEEGFTDCHPLVTVTNI